MEVMRADFRVGGGRERKEGRFIISGVRKDGKSDRDENVGYTGQPLLDGISKEQTSDPKNAIKLFSWRVPDRDTLLYMLSI